MIRRLLLFLLVVAVPCVEAQFSGLATDEAGTRLWFASPMKLRGTEQHLDPKIFSVDAGGNVELVAMQPEDDQRRGLRRPQVSGDGRTLTYEAFVVCVLSCRGAPGPMSFVERPGDEPLQLTGRVELSRNGRALLRHGYPHFGLTDEVELIDLESGAVRSWAVANHLPMYSFGQVADDGSALLMADGLWIIRPNGTFERVYVGNFFSPDPISDSVWPWATFDALGERVVVQTSNPPSYLAEAAIGLESTERTLVNAQNPTVRPVLSADGARALFLSRSMFDARPPDGLQHAWLLDTNTRAVRPAVSHPAGIEEAVLSGDGTVVWATTPAGNLLRADLLSGDVREVVPRTVFRRLLLGEPPVRPTPGGLVEVTGRGLAPRTAIAESPTTRLAGVELRADGRPLPLVSVSPTRIEARVPWDFQGQKPLSVTEAGSPFEDEMPLSMIVVEANPRFGLTEDGPAIAHGDFRGLVSEEDPAAPGEVLHLYMAGLGPVQNPPPPGEITPNAPLSRLAIPIDVTAIERPGADPAPIEVLFAGLAPGTAGFYQVSVRLPSGWSQSDAATLIVQAGGERAYASLAVR